jgi:hypothetical protein
VYLTWNKTALESASRHPQVTPTLGQTKRF